MRLHLLCEKSGAILLVLVGLMAGWQAGRQSDEILVDFEIFKILLQIALLGFSQRLSVITVLPMLFSQIFVKYIVKRVMKVCKKWNTMFFVSIPTIKYYRPYLMIKV